MAQPEVAIVSARSWGNWALQRRAWEEAVTAYTYGRQAIDMLFATQFTRQAKESWLKEAQGLPANAAYALAKLGRLEEAVEGSGGRPRPPAGRGAGGRTAATWSACRSWATAICWRATAQAADRIHRACKRRPAGQPAGKPQNCNLGRDFAAFIQEMEAGARRAGRRHRRHPPSGGRWPAAVRGLPPAAHLRQDPAGRHARRAPGLSDDYVRRQPGAGRPTEQRAAGHLA